MAITKLKEKEIDKKLDEINIAAKRIVERYLSEFVVKKNKKMDSGDKMLVATFLELTKEIYKEITAGFGMSREPGLLPKKEIKNLNERLDDLNEIWSLAKEDFSDSQNIYQFITRLKLLEGLISQLYFGGNWV